MPDDDILARIPYVVERLRRGYFKEDCEAAATVLEAAQVRIAELEGRGTPTGYVLASEYRRLLERAERAEAEAARYRALADFVQHLYERYLDGGSMDGSDWTRLVTLASTAEREPSEAQSLEPGSQPEKEHDDQKHADDCPDDVVHRRHGRMIAHGD